MGESKLTLTLIQIDCTLGEPDANFARAETMIAEAARRDSQLVMLPELWSTAYALEEAADHAARLVTNISQATNEPDDWFGRLAQLAKAHNIWLTGSILEAGSDGKFYNCMALYAPSGELAGVYRKLHLFRLMDEEVYLGAGQSPTLLDLPWGQTGLAICYDLRFPELFRGYALQGARLILIPAEWPHPRREHWRTLLRARAIENQCFVAACNRVGESKGTGFFGASAVIDPFGETCIEGGEAEMLLTATIDLAQVDSVRRHIPVFQDRRPEIYTLDLPSVDPMPS